MSWSSSYPPPPRHSRSRSPRAGSFPNRPDTGYQSEYWDDRWNSDGHRNTYENGRRGRSRSPPWDDSESSLSLKSSSNLCSAANRKRRRSPSPYERDRYDPRPRYNDDYGLFLFPAHFRYLIRLCRCSFARSWIFATSTRSSFSTFTARPKNDGLPCNSETIR